MARRNRHRRTPKTFPCQRRLRMSRVQATRSINSTLAGLIVLDVFLTVDSELSPDNLRPGAAVREEMDLSFYARTGQGDFGDEYHMDLLDAHGLKGLFY